MRECHYSLSPLITKLRAANANERPALFEQYEPKILSTYGHDTNYALLKSLLNELKTLKTQDQPRFVLLIGDYLAHDKYVAYSGDTTEEGYQSFVQKTLLFLTNEFHNTLPNMPMYAVIGNNDSYQGGYYSNPNVDFYRDLASMWASFIHRSKKPHSVFTNISLRWLL